MTVGLDPASASEAGILDNLMQLYIHDFSSFSPEPISNEGRFDYPFLAHYWREPDRHPFIIRKNGDLAGFALARVDLDPSNGISSMTVAEFFVLRGHRRSNVGGEAARLLWDQFPGNWYLSVYRTNAAGCAFWKPLIADYTNNVFQESEDDKVFGYSFKS